MLAALVFLLGIALIVSAIVLSILIFDGRPVIFKQSRLGQHRQPFTIYKFKTMINGQITPLGHFLRATGLDELPQIFNIWRGDMALTGPRPLTPADVTRLGWDAPPFDPRFTVRPGLMGYAQLVNICDQDLSYAADLRTISDQSFRQTIWLFILGLGVMILGRQRLKNLL